MNNLYSAFDRLTGNVSAFFHDQQSLVWRDNMLNREILALYCHDGMCTEDVGYLSLMLRSFDGADKLSLEPGFGIRIKVDLLNKTATPETWGNGATADPINETEIIANAIDECINCRVTDLCKLIDAAAKRGESICADKAAGWFLHRIAELALRAITR